MRLLVLTEEVWNDKIYPNNVMTNWFENFDGRLANLYLASGMPDNPCCREYFQITDWMVLEKLVGGKDCGRWFVNQDCDRAGRTSRTSPDPIPGKYSWIRKGMKPVFGGLFRLLRDAAWLRVRWEEGMLMDFLEDFKPDVIFSLRFSSRRILYMERFLHSVTGAPVIAFTGDDEYSLRQINGSPLYWIRRLQLRRDIRRNAAFYGIYYTLSERQAKELKKALGVNSAVLYKGGDFSGALEEKRISRPIRMVYGGRLYCNRDKTLLSIARAIAAINREEVLVTLEIYTGDKPGKRKRKELDDGRSVFLKGFVNAGQLKQIYGEADIALHVESFDLKNRLLTRYSFSTKIVDCLASTCAVLAVGPYDNEGIRYLKKNRGAICIGKEEEIYPVLSHIISHPDKIEVYRRNAWKLGIKAHRKEEIRQRLREDMASLVKAGYTCQWKESTADCFHRILRRNWRL
ncbi:MAG TPA: glycosyltransferase family 4 protein [Clostridiales bacterium]|nr:glycosyltransferase family 4 protein [Clostridiales bacterium]